MPRRPEFSPYQLLFDYRFRPEESSITYPVKLGAFTNFEHPESDAGRFIRSVKESFTVRMPADAAGYVIEQIYTPWEAFTQEELYTLMLDNRTSGRIRARTYGFEHFTLKAAIKIERK